MDNQPEQSHRHPDHQALVEKNKRMGLMVLGIVFGMVTLSFASVPLYDLFCRVTGFGGTTQVSESLPSEVIDRQMRIQFNADTSRQMAWEFGPEIRSVNVNVGERGLVNFIARNPADRPTAGTAVYNVTPLKAGKYFHKVQCFCFDEQILQPGQEVNMPVMFFVDPAIDDDPNMEDVETITLSYTFFKTDSSELDQALEAFYNSQ